MQVNPSTVPGFMNRTMICNPVTTSIYTNQTSPVNGSTVATVACPYSATLPAGVTLTNSTTNGTSGNGTVQATPSSATAAFTTALLPVAVALASIPLLML